MLWLRQLPSDTGGGIPSDMVNANDEALSAVKLVAPVANASESAVSMVI